TSPVPRLPSGREAGRSRKDRRRTYPMDIPKLKPAEECEAEASMHAFFDVTGTRFGSISHGLTELVTTMFHRSMEAAWPSMLSLGRGLEGREFHSRDWAFRQAVTGNPWHVCFVAENADGCGYLYVLELEKEKSEAYRQKEAERFKEVYAIEDLDKRRAAIA